MQTQKADTSTELPIFNPVARKRWVVFCRVSA